MTYLSVTLLYFAYSCLTERIGVNQFCSQFCSHLPMNKVLDDDGTPLLLRTFLPPQGCQACSQVNALLENKDVVLAKAKCDVPSLLAGKRPFSTTVALLS